MATLVLMFNKQVIREYPFLKGSITIGRKSENTIAIDNLAVSGYHARIDMMGSSFLLTDLQSTNGTFLNDKRIISHKLSHGDNITIGKHSLLFVAGDEPITSENEVDLDQTMMLDTEKQRELLAQQKKTNTSALEPRKEGVLSFIDGSNREEIVLTKKLTRLGKSPNSEVRFPGLFVGSTAATISKRPSGYAITFIGGLVKLKVNGEIIKGNVPLKDFDTVELGAHKFQFYEKETGKA